MFPPLVGIYQSAFIFVALSFISDKWLSLGLEVAIRIIFLMHISANLADQN